LVEFVSSLLLPFGLCSIMYGLGMSISILDFQRLFRFPKAISIGILAQIIGLPTIAFLLSSIANLPPEMAVGLVILAACPGGVTSNAITFLGRADVALSVTMTSITSLISIATIPLVVVAAIRLFFGNSEHFELNTDTMAGKLFFYTALPIAAGFATRIFLPAIAAKLLVILRPATFGIVLTIITFSVLVNWQLVKNNIVHLGPVALLMNFVCMTFGFWLGHCFSINQRQTMTIAIELGVQNVTLATFVATTILNRIDLAAAATIYGIIMVVSALTVITFFKNGSVLPINR
jgi:bile acid:Na+ symporter, BASS family